MLGHKLVQSFDDVFDTYYTLHGAFESVEDFGIFDRSRAVEDVDVEDLDTVRRAIERTAPDVVVNAVGVIKQVQAAGDVEKTLKINSIFPHRLARLAAAQGFRLITVSTDCVFAGTRGNYSEDDVPDALDLYGQSKHWGELSEKGCLTLRTSIIGREICSKNGLLEWFFSRRGDAVKGYSKAIFSGFPTIVFADILIDIIEKYPDIDGIFHVSSDPISKYEILRMIEKQFGLGVRIDQDTDFVMDRSLDSTKFRETTGFVPAAWGEMIDRMRSDATPYDKWNDHKN